MNKQYEALLRAQNSPTSQMETFSESARDPFTDHMAPRFHDLTLAEATELKRKHPDLYEQLFVDSCWD